MFRLPEVPLEKLESLTDLSIVDCEISPSELVRMIKKLSLSIRVLIIVGCTKTVPDIKYDLDLQRLPNLIRITLEGISAKVFDFSKIFKQLFLKNGLLHVSLAENGITTEFNDKVLSNSNDDTKKSDGSWDLLTLDISGNEIDSSDLCNVIGSLNSNIIETLIVNYTGQFCGMRFKSFPKQLTHLSSEYLSLYYEDKVSGQEIAKKSIFDSEKSRITNLEIVLHDQDNELFSLLCKMTTLTYLKISIALSSESHCTYSWPSGNDIRGNSPWHSKNLLTLEISQKAMLEYFVKQSKSLSELETLIFHAYIEGKDLHGIIEKLADFPHLKFINVRRLYCYQSEDIPDENTLNKYFEKHQEQYLKIQSIGIFLWLKNFEFFSRILNFLSKLSNLKSLYLEILKFDSNQIEKSKKLDKVESLNLFVRHESDISPILNLMPNLQNLTVERKKFSLSSNHDQVKHLSIIGITEISFEELWELLVHLPCLVSLKYDGKILIDNVHVGNEFYRKIFYPLMELSGLSSKEFKDSYLMQLFNADLRFMLQTNTSGLADYLNKLSTANDLFPAIKSNSLVTLVKDSHSNESIFLSIIFLIRCFYEKESGPISIQSMVELNPVYLEFNKIYKWKKLSGSVSNVASQTNVVDALISSAKSSLGESDFNESIFSILDKKTKNNSQLKSDFMLLVELNIAIFQKYFECNLPAPANFYKYLIQLLSGNDREVFDLIRKENINDQSSIDVTDLIYFIEVKELLEKILFSTVTNTNCHLISRAHKLMPVFEPLDTKRQDIFENLKKNMKTSTKFDIDNFKGIKIDFEKRLLNILEVIKKFPQECCQICYGSFEGKEFCEFKHERLNVALHLLCMECFHKLIEVNGIDNVVCVSCREK